MHETLVAAKQLQEEGLSCEVIDVATIKPLDSETILASVSKTGRCVIVHEGAKTCGVGAEISAQIMEHCLPDLLAPVLRVTGYDTIMPYFQLEKEYIPSVSRIKNSIMSIME